MTILRIKNIEKELNSLEALYEYMDNTEEEMC
jgi:hypothetical protein